MSDVMEVAHSSLMCMPSWSFETRGYRNCDSQNQNIEQCGRNLAIRNDLSLSLPWEGMECFDEVARDHRTISNSRHRSFMAS